MDQFMRAQLRDDGFCIIPDVLTQAEVAQVRAALDRAVEDARRRGISTYNDFTDPNPKNVRVYNLPNCDPCFVELLRRPAALEAVSAVIGPHFIVSNFTANIALPGSGSMKLHSDQAVTVPAPWDSPLAVNVIWCLDDVHEANGATRYLPASHRYRTLAELPPDAVSKTRAFTAKAGSIIVMEGRVWHTSGMNVTMDQERAMMFAYYTADFIRSQVNHEVILSDQAKAWLDDEARKLLGMGPDGNVRVGSELMRPEGAVQDLLYKALA